MLEDPYYGLNNAYNYFRWNVLNADGNATSIQQKLFFQSELRTYFALSSAQVQELTANWIDLYELTNQAMYQFNPALQDTFAIMYWQWAASAITNTADFGYKQSISDLSQSGMTNDNVFSGYYEFSTFHTYLMQQLNANNTANAAIFNSVSMSTCDTPPACSSTYANLFYTYDVSSSVGTDPPSNSLFHIENMQILVDLGMSTPNILTNSSATYNVTFTLSSGWQNLTN